MARPLPELADRFIHHGSILRILDRHVGLYGRRRLVDERIVGTVVALSVTSC